MKTKTILKENTTPRCHESFLLKNHTMIRGGDHPWLEMLVDCLLVDVFYLSTIVVVDLLAKVVMGLQEVVVMMRQEVVVIVLQEVAVMDTHQTKFQDHML